MSTTPFLETEIVLAELEEEFDRRDKLIDNIDLVA